MAAARASGSRSNPSRARSRRGSPPPRHRGLGLLFWLCLAAIVIAVAVAAREPLRAAVAQLQGKPAPAAPGRETPKVTIAPIAERDNAANRPTAVPTSSATSTARSAPGSRAGSGSGSTAGTASGPASVQAPAQPALSVERTPAAAVPDHPAIRKARLYFAAVDDAGRITLKSVIRPIPASDSPLTDTLESLLKGPTSQEMNLGLISMIPIEARLRSAVVKGDTAILDFNEGFRFNPQGVEAMDAQIRQVVYAATEFPSVRKVQIRIEGATVRYLGTEGVRLDAPLSRDSFQ